VSTAIANDWVTLVTILGAGLVTLASRASFIALPAQAEPPLWFRRALKYVGAAVLPALILPDVLFRELASGDVVNVYRIIAAIIALLVAWRTSNIFATLGAGMAVLWMLKWWQPF
jgi:branched-subunit amino acid transport protein